MKVPEINILLRFADYLIVPFMFLFGGFTFPIQESHPWHMQTINHKLLDKVKMITVSNYDSESKFFHGSSFGLYHMPIFGGLTKYIVIEVKGYNNHWHVGWDGIKCQINKLKVFDNRLKLLYGKNSYKVFGLDDKGNFLKIKIVGNGKIGDGKFGDLRLF